MKHIIGAMPLNKLNEQGKQPLQENSPLSIQGTPALGARKSISTPSSMLLNRGNQQSRTCAPPAPNQQPSVLPIQLSAQRLAATSPFQLPANVSSEKSFSLLHHLLKSGSLPQSDPSSSPQQLNPVSERAADRNYTFRPASQNIITFHHTERDDVAKVTLFESQQRPVQISDGTNRVLAAAASGDLPLNQDLRTVEVGHDSGARKESTGYYRKMNSKSKKEFIVLVSADDDHETKLKSQDVLQNAFWLRKRKPDVGGKQARVKSTPTVHKVPVASFKSPESTQNVEGHLDSSDLQDRKEKQAISIKDQRSHDYQLGHADTQKLEMLHGKERLGIEEPALSDPQQRAHYYSTVKLHHRSNISASNDYSYRIDTGPRRCSEKQSQSEISTALLPIQDSEHAYQNAQSSMRYLKPGKHHILSVKTLQIRAPSPQQYSNEYSIPYQVDFRHHQNQSTILSIDRSLIDRHRQIIKTQESLLNRTTTPFDQPHPYNQTSSSFFPLAGSVTKSNSMNPPLVAPVTGKTISLDLSNVKTLQRSLNRTGSGPHFAGFKRSDLPKYAKQRNTKPFVNCKRQPPSDEIRIRKRGQDSKKVIWRIGSQEDATIGIPQARLNKEVGTGIEEEDRKMIQPTEEKASDGEPNAAATVETQRIKKVEISTVDSYRQAQMMNQIEDYNDKFAQTSIMSSKRLKRIASGGGEADTSDDRSVKENLITKVAVSPVLLATLKHSIQHQGKDVELKNKVSGTPTSSGKFLQPQTKLRDSLNTSHGAVDSMNFSPRRALQNLDSKIFMRNILDNTRDGTKPNEGSSQLEEGVDSNSKSAVQQVCTFGDNGDKEQTSQPLSNSFGELAQLSNTQKSKQASINRTAQQKLLHLSEVAAGAIKESDNESQLTSMQKNPSAMLSKYPAAAPQVTSYLDAKNMKNNFQAEKPGDPNLKFILNEESNELITLNEGQDPLLRVSDDRMMKQKSRQHQENATRQTYKINPRVHGQNHGNIDLSSQSSLAQGDALENRSTPAMNSSEAWRHSKSVNTANQGQHNQSRLAETHFGETFNEVRRGISPNQQYWETPLQIQEKEIEIQNKSNLIAQERQLAQNLKKDEKPQQIAQKSFMFKFDAQQSQSNKNKNGTLKASQATIEKSPCQKRLPLRDRSLQLRSRSKNRGESRQSQIRAGLNRPAASKATAFLNQQKRKRMQQIHLQMRADQGHEGDKKLKKMETTDGSTMIVDHSEDGVSLIPKLEEQRNSTPHTQQKVAMSKLRGSRKFASRDNLQIPKKRINFVEEDDVERDGGIKPFQGTDEPGDEQRSDADINEQMQHASFGGLGALQASAKKLHKNSDQFGSKSLSEDRFRITEQPMYWQNPPAKQQSAKYSSLLGAAQVSNLKDTADSVNEKDAKEATELAPEGQVEGLDTRVSNMLSKTKSKAFYKYAVVTNSPGRKFFAQRHYSYLQQDQMGESERQAAENKKKQVLLLQRLSAKEKRKTIGQIVGKSSQNDEHVRSLSPYGEIKKQSLYHHDSKYSTNNLVSQTRYIPTRKHVPQRPSMIELAKSMNMYFMQAPGENLHPVSNTQQINTDYEHLRAKQIVQSQQDLLLSNHLVDQRKLMSKGYFSSKQIIQRNAKSTAVLGKRMPARGQYSKAFLKQINSVQPSPSSSSSSSDFNSSHRNSLKMTQDYVREHELQARLNQSTNKASIFAGYDGHLSSTLHAQTQTQFFTRPFGFGRTRESNSKDKTDQLDSTLKTQSARRSTKRSIGQQKDVSSAAVSVMSQLTGKQKADMNNKMVTKLKPTQGGSANDSHPKAGPTTGQHADSSGSGQNKINVKSRSQQKVDSGQGTDDPSFHNYREMQHQHIHLQMGDQKVDVQDSWHGGNQEPNSNFKSQVLLSKKSHQLPKVLKRAQNEARRIHDKLENLTDPLKIGNLKDIYYQCNPAPILLQQSKYHKVSGQMEQYNRSISQNQLPKFSDNLLEKQVIDRGKRVVAQVAKAAKTAQMSSLHPPGPQPTNSSMPAFSSFQLNSNTNIPSHLNMHRQYQTLSKTNPIGSPFVNKPPNILSSTESPQGSTSSNRHHSQQPLNPTLLPMRPSLPAGGTITSSGQNQARNPYTAEYTQVLTKLSGSEEVVAEGTAKANKDRQNSDLNGTYGQKENQEMCPINKPSGIQISMKSSHSRDAAIFRVNDDSNVVGQDQSFRHSQEVAALLGGGHNANQPSSTQYISLNNSQSIQTHYRRINNNPQLSTLSRQGEQQLGNGSGSKENPDMGSQQRASTNSGMSGMKHLMMIVDLVDKQRQQDEEEGQDVAYGDAKEHDGDDMVQEESNQQESHQRTSKTDLYFTSLNKNSTISN